MGDLWERRGDDREKKAWCGRFAGVGLVVCGRILGGVSGAKEEFSINSCTDRQMGVSLRATLRQSERKKYKRRGKE